jgi:heme/copper-type cytochrome/quinol oxidase subunit 4
MKTFLSYTAGFILLIVIGLLPIYLTVITDNGNWLIAYPVALIILIYILNYPTDDNDGW